MKRFPIISKEMFKNKHNKARRMDGVFFSNKQASQVVNIKSVSTSGEFIYKINEKTVVSQDRLYFTKYRHWFFATESKKIDQILHSKAVRSAIDP